MYVTKLSLVGFRTRARGSYVCSRDTDPTILYKNKTIKNCTLYGPNLDKKRVFFNFRIVYD